MLTDDTQAIWSQFLECLSEKCSATEFENWLAPIKVLTSSHDEITLEVPNIFVRDYLMDNYKKELCAFLPLKASGEPSITFIIAEPKKKQAPIAAAAPVILTEAAPSDLKLNPFYLFQNFIEGPENQFVKSAAMGVASRPSRTYNPLFIHGGVGLGKTHLLHAIGHHVKVNHKKLKIQCITTEAFINDLVDNLRNKSIDRMKNFYRSLDVLLVDDIQFLQNRLNFEEEFCNTFESLINQNKQIVITSDKPPGQLKLSERMIGRMEWGLVAHLGVPDFETRVAILQHKAEQRGLKLPQKVAFFIAEHIFNNVRQLEGALNRLSAYCRLMGLEASEEVVEKTMGELFQGPTNKKVSVDNIIKSVAIMFGIKENDLKGTSRTKSVALPRQVAMYLAKELIKEPLQNLAALFGGKTHSTLLHAWKKISEQVEKDEKLKRQIQMTRRNLES